MDRFPRFKCNINHNFNPTLGHQTVSPPEDRCSVWGSLQAEDHSEMDRMDQVAYQALEALALHRNLKLTMILGVIFITRAT